MNFQQYDPKEYIPLHPHAQQPPSIIEYRTRYPIRSVYHDFQSANEIELSTCPNIQLTRQIYTIFLNRIKSEDVNNLYIIAPRYYSTRYRVQEDIQFLVTGTRDYSDSSIEKTVRREGFEETGLNIGNLEPFYNETNYNKRHNHEVISTYYMSNNFNSNITHYKCKEGNDDKTQKIGLILYGTHDHVIGHLNELFRRFQTFPHQNDNPWRCLSNDDIQSVCAIKLTYLLGRLERGVY